MRERYKHRGSEELSHVTQPNGKSGKQKVKCVVQNEYPAGHRHSFSLGNTGYFTLMISQKST